MKSRLAPSALTLAFALLAGGFALGCGSVDPSANHRGAGGDGSGGDGSGGTKPEGPLLPWAVGNNWTYRITKDGVVSLKTTTIGDLEPVGGAGPTPMRWRTT